MKIDLAIINMNKIEEVNKKYKLRIQKISNCSALVYTGLNEWMIEVGIPSIRNKKYIKLFHKNTRRNRNGWHHQRDFFDYEWTLGYINHHDSPKTMYSPYVKNKNKKR